MQIHRHANGHLSVAGFNTVSASSSARNSAWEQFSSTPQLAAVQFPAHIELDSCDHEARRMLHSDGAIAYANLSLFFRMLNHFGHLYRGRGDRDFWENVLPQCRIQSLNIHNIQFATMFWLKARQTYKRSKRYSELPCTYGLAGIVDCWEDKFSSATEAPYCDDQWNSSARLWLQVRTHNRMIPPWSNYWQKNAEMVTMPLHGSIATPPLEQSIQSPDMDQWTPASAWVEDRSRDVQQRPLTIKGCAGGGNRRATSPAHSPSQSNTDHNEPRELFPAPSIASRNGSVKMEADDGPQLRLPPRPPSPTRHAATASGHPDSRATNETMSIRKRRGSAVDDTASKRSRTADSGPMASKQSLENSTTAPAKSSNTALPLQDQHVATSMAVMGALETTAKAWESSIQSVSGTNAPLESVTAEYSAFRSVVTKMIQSELATLMASSNIAAASINGQVAASDQRIEVNERSWRELTSKCEQIETSLLTDLLKISALSLKVEKENFETRSSISSIRMELNDHILPKLIKTETTNRNHLGAINNLRLQLTQLVEKAEKIKIDVDASKDKNNVLANYNRIEARLTGLESMLSEHAKLATTLDEIYQIHQLQEHMHESREREDKARDSRLAELETEAAASKLKIEYLDRELSDTRRKSEAQAARAQALQEQVGGMESSFQQELQKQMDTIEASFQQRMQEKLGALHASFEQQLQKQAADSQKSFEQQLQKLAANVQNSFEQQLNDTKTKIAQTPNTQQAQAQAQASSSIDEATSKELIALRQSSETQKKLIDDLRLEVREHRMHIRNQSQRSAAEPASASHAAELKALHDQVDELRKRVMDSRMPTPDAPGTSGGTLPSADRSPASPVPIAALSSKNRAQRARVLGVLADLRKDGNDTVTMSMDMVNMINSLVGRE